MKPHNALVKIASVEMIVRFADGAAQQFDFHGGEQNVITVDISSARLCKVEATITVAGSGRLVTLYAKEGK